MQIHELNRKSRRVNETWMDTVKDIGGSVKTAVTSPYQSAKAAVKGTPGLTLTQKVASAQQDKMQHNMARKFRQAWEVYAVNWAKSKGGQYTAPGRAKPPAPTPAPQATTPPPARPTPAPGPGVGAQYNIPAIQRQNKPIPQTTPVKEGITPGTLLPSYEQALKAFVQKNLLSGTQYNRLQNAQDIDKIIKDIVDPTNDTSVAQEALWDKLVLAASVAQHDPGQYSPAAQTAAPAAATTTATQGQAQQPTAANNTTASTLNQIMTGIGVTVNPQQLKMLGQAMQQDSGINEIHGNGDPVLAQLLTQMGYRVL